MLKAIVGNGHEVFLWQDNWHSRGPLLIAYGQDVTFLSGLPLDTRLSSVIEDSCWHWPHTRSTSLLEIQQLSANVVVSQHTEDKVIWLPSKSQVFHTGATWNQLRTRNPKSASVSSGLVLKLYSQTQFYCLVDISG